MIQFLEYAINKDGKIYLPNDIHFQNDVIKVFMSAKHEKKITDSRSQCIFCGGTEHLVHVNGKTICGFCKKAIMNDEFAESPKEIVADVVVEANNVIHIPTGVPQIYALHGIVLLLINCEESEITIIPAKTGINENCLICNISGNAQNLYQIGQDYFCIDCLQELQQSDYKLEFYSSLSLC